MPNQNVRTKTDVRTRYAIAAMAVALPLLTTPGIALALEDTTTVDDVVPSAVAETVTETATTESTTAASTPIAQEVSSSTSTTTDEQEAEGVQKNAREDVDEQDAVDMQEGVEEESINEQDGIPEKSNSEHTDILPSEAGGSSTLTDVPPAPEPTDISHADTISTSTSSTSTSADPTSTSADISSPDVSPHTYTITSSSLSTNASISVSGASAVVAPAAKTSVVAASVTKTSVAAGSAPLTAKTLAAKASNQTYESVEKGIYELNLASSSGNGTSRSVDVRAGSTASGEAVQIYESNHTGAQLWDVQPTSDGYYTLRNVGSGKYLSISQEDLKYLRDETDPPQLKGVSLQQLDSDKLNDTNTDAHHWKLIADATRSGYYTLRSRLNETFAITASSTTSTSTSGSLYLAAVTSGDANQIFAFVTTRPLSDGVYTLENSGSHKMLDISAASLKDSGNAQQYASNKTQAQSFYVHYDTQTGSYTLTNVQSGKALDVRGGGNANGTNVQQYTLNGTKAQSWAIRKNADNTWSVYSTIGGKALDVKWGSTANSANVWIYTPNQTSAQSWNFKKNDQWLTGGTYRVLAANNTANVIGIKSNSTANSAQAVTTSASIASTFNKWQLVWDNKEVKLIDIATGKALDVKGANTASGTKVQQYISNGTSAQRWIPTMTPTGIKLVSSLSSTRALDISNNSTGQNVALQIFQDNDTYAQRFIFVPTTLIDAGHIYTIRLDGDTFGSSSDYVLDVKNGSTSPNASIQSYVSNGTGAQQFIALDAGNGAYYLQNTQSALYISSSAGSREVKQTATKNASARWILSFDAQTDSVVLKSQGSGLILTTARPYSSTVSVAARKAGNSTQGFLFTEQARTTLNGIDISGWNYGIDLSKVAGDFVIIKATQGTTYKNAREHGDTAYYRKLADAALKAGKLIGFYHFPNSSRGAVKEANYFYEAVKPYIGRAVLVLDWENNDQNKQNNLKAGVSYAKKFLDRVYSLSGVKPLIYMSRSVTKEYNWSSVANAGYGLWVAQYLYKYYDKPQVGYVNNPTLTSGGFGAWKKPTIYQYTSNGRLSGTNNTLDLDVFYGTRADWLKLARSSK